jgi:hypothetical protein
MDGLPTEILSLFSKDYLLRGVPSRHVMFKDEEEEDDEQMTMSHSAKLKS